MDKGAILLKDLVGEKSESVIVGVFRRVAGRSSGVNILRGELVEPIPGEELAPRGEGQKPYNYRVKKDPAVLVYCHEQDIAPLGDKEFLLLEAIPTPAARYEVFVSGEKMDWGCNLKRGDTVYCSIPGLTVLPNQRAAAVIRFVGGLHPEPGLKFGIEIKDPQYRGKGTTDGTFRDQRYFHCEDNCGLFVALDKLSPDSQGSSLTEEPRSGKSYAKVTSHGPPQGGQSTPAGNTRSRSQAISRHESKESSVDRLPPPRFKLGDRVVAFNKKGIRVHGTVRWVGRNTASQKFTVTIAGIETDVAVSTAEFEGSRPGMTYLFAAAKKHQLFLPETAILGEEEGTGVNDGQQNKPHPPQNIDVENTAALAREMGVSAETLMANQTEALREAKLVKQAKEMELLKQAVPDESLHFDAQKAALYAFEKENIERMQAKAGKRGSLPPGTEVYVDEPNYLKPNHQPERPQRQHSYEPVGRKYLGNQSKAASIAQGEQFYDRLDTRGYQPEPSHASHYTPKPPPQAQHYPQPQQSFPQQLSQSDPHPVPPQQLDPPHPDHFSAEPVGAQGPVAYASPRQQGVHLGELDVGSAVQISDPPRYGVIRWIGELPNIQGYVAGVELDEYMDGCTDGTWHERRYFTCPYGRGFFCPYCNLLPDRRFDTGGNMPGAAPAVNPLVDYPLEERADQTIERNQMMKYLGDQRGIQGHQNSCYLDATVFGLFALSDDFDSMFLEEARDHSGKEISNILWKGIVNPLRKNGVVRYESVMKLRNKLEELGKMKGVNQDEKDPEEFLNLLFKHILNVEPFVHIKRPFGVEPEYFVQLFVDYDESLKLPTVGELMKKMFREQDITFIQAPSKLLIQVPRFGKQYKTYEKIIPAAKLNVADLIVSPHHCFNCEKSAWKQCSACAHEYRSEERTAGGFVYFCDSCSHVVHSPKSRSKHTVQNVAQTPEVADVSELDLLSVICIETSHYVCFVHWDKRWIFFDSMANRVYDMYNIPKGVDCTHDLNEWVYSEDDHKRLLNTPPRELPEYVRRFTQDVYMCVYVNHDVGMYI